jgi:hypothetical protein
MLVAWLPGLRLTGDWDEAKKQEHKRNWPPPVDAKKALEKMGET